MVDRRVISLVVAVIVGASLGYTLGYVVLQSGADKYASELAAAKRDLNATRLSLSAREAELRRSADSVKTLEARVTALTGELEETRRLYASSSNETIARFSAQLLEKEGELAAARSELASMKLSRITLEARGSGLVSDFDRDVVTNRTLVVELGWTREEGWTGDGFYTVESAESNPETGLTVGYVYVFEYVRLDNVTVTGGAVEARGTVHMSDRQEITKGMQVVIKGVDGGAGQDEAVSIAWPELDEEPLELVGEVTISLPP